MLAFEIVDFSGPYHIILGRPCYIKFMAIPSYAYLKLKIPGPTGLSPWRPRRSGRWTMSRTISSWPPLLSLLLS
jgi:hypothetical protein